MLQLSGDEAKLVIFYQFKDSYFDWLLIRRRLEEYMRMSSLHFPEKNVDSIPLKRCCHFLTLSMIFILLFLCLLLFCLVAIAPIPRVAFVGVEVGSFLALFEGVVDAVERSGKAGVQNRGQIWSHIHSAANDMVVSQGF